MATTSQNPTTTNPHASTAGSTPALAYVVVEHKHSAECWNYFEKVKLKNGVFKAKCVNCEKLLATGGNSTLTRHVTSCTSKMSPEATQSQIGPTGYTWNYDQALQRDMQMKLIISQGYPFNHFDNDGTTNYIHRGLQPKYQKVSRITIRRDAIKGTLEDEDRSTRMFNESLNALFQHYELLNGSRPREVAPRVGSSFMDIILSQAISRKKSRTIGASSELTKYSQTDFGSLLSQQSFNILEFWKSQAPYYPIMAAMARDFLTVQASTVASESAFSFSGRVLNERRSSLSPQSLEVCICYKDHLDAERRQQDTESIEESLEEIEEEIWEYDEDQDENQV
ncbi:hypothetical protein POM88_032349 [Heracleum sosnowskyi]|uniref:BED-type domain-containing protein n=1 Tax=Heracleum sosnowskyi TaxID=360622 RepID=A0AAD8MJZ3_9APIA|nr:hypothetical protein POM88_032349 [Heracleum sosnowskyi]